MAKKQKIKPDKHDPKEKEKIQKKMARAMKKMEEEKSKKLKKEQGQLEKKKAERERRIEKREIRKRRKWEKKAVNFKKIIPINIILAVILGGVAFYFTKKWANASITSAAVFVLSTLYFFIKSRMQASIRIKKMENAFPDFLQLMASNLRAGMTIDRALLLSARKEFSPLDKEIIRLGKDIITGKKIEQSLQDMSKRINSEKIQKTILVIISGIRSGGNLAILLEETSSNMRERGFVEKRAASNVLMYVIFIFFATGIGAPVLFALSSILVSVLSSILATVPDVSSTAANVNIPFTLSQINVPISFIIYFALTFMIAIDILGSLVIGLVSKGEEKAGLKYIVPLISVSVVIYFTVRIFLLNYFGDLFS